MRMLGLVATLVVSSVLALGCGGAPKSPPSTPQASGGAAPGTAAPDAQLTDTSGGRVALAGVLHRRAETVVVFYRGFWWSSCVRWLGELARHSAELESRDIGVVAIAADSVADTAALQAKVVGVLLLTDPGLAASAAWGVRLPDADSPSPGTFVVGRDGLVRWRRLEDPRGDWPTYAELNAAL